MVVTEAAAGATSMPQTANLRTGESKVQDAVEVRVGDLPVGAANGDVAVFIIAPIDGKGIGNGLPGSSGKPVDK